MAIALVVTQPFAEYAKGDHITDPNTVKAIIEHHHHRVVKIAIEDPKPATVPAAKD